MRPRPKQPRFMNTRLLYKIVSGFMVGVVLAIIVGWAGISGMGTMLRHYSEVADDIQSAQIILSDLVGAMNAQTAALRGYVLLSTDSSFAGIFKRDQQQIEQLAERLTKLPSYEKYKSDFDRLLITQTTFSRIGNDVVEAVQADKKEQAIILITLEAAPSVKFFADQSTELRKRLEAAGEQAQIQAKKAAGSAKMTVYVVLLAVASSGLVVGLYLARLITRPMQDLATAAQKVAGGDLAVNDVQAYTSDEVGQASAAFNTMVSNLRGIIKDVTVSSQTVAQTSRELKLAANQAASASQSVAEAVNQVASGTQEQSRAVSETSGVLDRLRRAIEIIARGAQEQSKAVELSVELVNRMSKAMEEVTSRAERAAEASGRTSETARRGAGAVRQSIEGMRTIRQSVAGVAERINLLGKDSEQIGQITGVITEIADQTNLLALNAAIEAARAGEHGRGFAVVADEVRKLAERSSRSAKEIGGLIGKIQANTTEAVKGMQTGTEQVESGSRLAENAGRALDEILETVRETVSEIQAISTSSQDALICGQEVARSVERVSGVSESNHSVAQEMASGAQAVLNSVSRVAEISQGNAAATEEVAATTQQVSSSSEEISGAAGQLAEVAHHMQNQVARFRL